MLYLIGGVSRSGKSLVAERLLKTGTIPYTPLDSIVMGFTNGIPEYGVHDRLFPDEIARRLWPFTKAMCENLIFVGKDHTIDGEAFLPSHINELRDAHPGKLRACYLGYCETSVKKKIAEVKRYGDPEHDWLLRESEQSINGHICSMIEYSHFVRRECEKHGVRYFDTSDNFSENIDAAAHFLAGN